MQVRAALQVFQDSVTTDPLFAAEGMDLERGISALQGMSDSLEKIQDLLGEGSFVKRVFLLRYPLHRYLYPIGFLRHFIESERARRRFLTLPSTEHAGVLLSAWRAAAYEYRAAVLRHRRLHEVILSHDDFIRGKKLFFDKIGNSFTLQDVYRCLSLLERNAGALEADVAHRAALLRGESTHVAAPKHATIDEGEPRKLSMIERTMIELNTERHEEESVLLERVGPISLRLPHFDGKPTIRNFFVFFLRNKAGGYTFVRVEPTDLFYFLPVGTAEARYGFIGKEVFQSAIDRGVRYWMQTGTRFYTTRDQQYFADVLTLADKKRRPSLETALVDAQRSSLLDYMLMTGVEEIGMQIQAARARRHFKSLASYPLGAALLAHGHTSIYFLPFNGSIWRLPEKASFIGSGRAAPGQSLHRTLDDVYPTVSKEELREMIRGGMNRVHDWKAKGIL